MPAATASEPFVDPSRQTRWPKRPPRERKRARASSYLLFAGEFAQHDLPVHHIVVERLHGQALVLAVGAIVDRNYGPATVGTVDRDAGNTERPGIARAGRHRGQDRHAGMKCLDGL